MRFGGPTGSHCVRAPLAGCVVFGFAACPVVSTEPVMQDEAA